MLAGSNARAAAVVAAAITLWGCGGGGVPSGLVGGKTSAPAAPAGGGAAPSGGGAAPSGGGSAGGVSPTVVETVPSAQSTSAPTNGSVAIVFSEAMDQATLTPTTLSLVDTQLTPVPTQIFYDPNLFIATIYPSQTLAPGAQYTVTIDASVAAASGATFGQPMTFGFLTTQGPAKGPITFSGVAAVTASGSGGVAVSWPAALSPDYAANELYYTFHTGASAQSVDWKTVVATAGLGATQAQLGGIAAGTYVGVRAWDMAGDSDANTNTIALASGAPPSSGGGSSSSGGSSSASGGSSSSGTSAGTPSFATDIETGIFQNYTMNQMGRKCTSCHPSQNGLDLKTYAGVMSGGQSGPGVVASSPSQSTIYEHISSPSFPGTSQAIQHEVPDSAKQALASWINAGAPNN
jgi:hypothetical protein